MRELRRLSLSVLSSIGWSRGASYLFIWMEGLKGRNVCVNEARKRVAMYFLPIISGPYVPATVAGRN